MKRISWIITLVTVCVLTACSNYNVFDIEAFRVSKYTPKYASGFEILALPDSSATLLKITTPWQGATQNDHHLLILEQGQAAPKGFRGAIISREAERVICVSSSNIAMFEAIGEAERVVGVSGVEYISNETIQRGYSERKVLDIGYGANLNFEAIVSLRPDLVILYGVSGEEVSITTKFKELGIDYIYVGDYAEESPLGKAEWMVAIAEICGKGELGEKVFNDIERRYNEAKGLVTEEAERPKVMLNTPYRDVWYMPSSKSYMVRLIEDAGGEYIYTGNNSPTTEPISLESAYQLVAKADVWLNVGATIRSMEVLKSQNPLFSKMPVVERREVYNSTARGTAGGGSDFYESGVIAPDVILLDLIRIMHPTKAEEHDLYYYERLK